MDFKTDAELDAMTPEELKAYLKPFKLEELRKKCKDLGVKEYGSKETVLRRLNKKPVTETTVEDNDVALAIALEKQLLESDEDDENLELYLEEDDEEIFVDVPINMQSSPNKSSQDESYIHTSRIVKNVLE